MVSYTFCTRAHAQAAIGINMPALSKYGQQGAALMMCVLALLNLAFIALTVTGQQVLGHAQQVTLDEQRLYRQLATEQLFDEVAQNLELNSNALQKRQSSHLFAQGGAGQRVLYSSAMPTTCPHEGATESLCWQIQISQSGSGFIRERMLIIPEQGCALPYWYPPQGRVLEGAVLPPANEPPAPVKPVPIPSK